MNPSFEQKLAFGRIHEGYIAAWLRRCRQWTILPIYPDDTSDEEKKMGPRLFGPNQSLVAPDLLVMRERDVFWVEVKTKTHFSWYRKGQRWTTGIDAHLYRHYQEVHRTSPFPVWLLFLHLRDDPKGGNGRCPVGLFGGELSRLTTCESHQSPNWGTSGMVYWARESLTLLASVEEVMGAAEATAASQRRGAAAD